MSKLISKDTAIAAENRAASMEFTSDLPSGTYQGTIQSQLNTKVGVMPMYRIDGRAVNVPVVHENCYGADGKPLARISFTIEEKRVVSVLAA